MSTTENPSDGRFSCDPYAAANRFFLLFIDAFWRFLSRTPTLEVSKMYCPGLRL
jgi:hypothetical protein